MKYDKAHKALKDNLGGAETALLLIREADKLKQIIMKVWMKYENSYEPVRYNRKGSTRSSLANIQVSAPFMMGMGHMGIRLNFPNDLYHMSILNSKRKTHPKGHSFMLISEGWHSKKLEARFGERRDRFTYYSGFNLIGQIFDMYENEKSKLALISLSYEWQGKGNYTK